MLIINLLHLTKMSFTIATLTCNDRESLFLTIESFCKNTNINCDWHIFLQGCTGEYLNRVTQFIEQFKNVQFHLKTHQTNLGLSKGQNVIADMVKEYEYVLQLEDDWYCLPEKITGLSKEWLETCLQFLEKNKHVSTLYLRKYVDEMEKFKYAWTRHVEYKNHVYKKNFNYAKKMEGSDTRVFQEIKFQHIPQFLFTFNPCIRRNTDYYKVGVFPLLELKDINSKRGEWLATTPEDVPMWGWCEAIAMEKTRNLITYNVGSGIFGHQEDWQKVVDKLQLVADK